MAVVLRNTKISKNADGLHVRYNSGEAQLGNVGEFMDTADGRHCIELVLDLTTLPTVASGDEQIQSETVAIPSGAFIEEVVVFVDKETAGTNANLDLGLVDQDGSTEIDFNGLLAAADAFNAGTDLGGVFRFARVDGSLTTEGGALLGTKITNAGYITASADTGDFTAGVLRIRIYYHVPLTADV